MARRRKVALADRTDARFVEPLYTVRETAYYLRRSLGTVGPWVHGGQTGLPPLVTSISDGRRLHAEVPFIGLAQAVVVNVLRSQGVTMPTIRKALIELQRDMTLDYALASRRLKTDGAKVWFRYAKTSDEPDVGHLANVVSQQFVLDGVINETGLHVVSFADDGWAGRLVLPFGNREIVEVDPSRGFGKPLFINGGAPLMSVLERLFAREPMEEVADDFDVPVEDIEDVLVSFIPEPVPVAS
jgi:uncharacterized protein (DUF433 family)